jgi:hypothetical protein
MLTYQPLQHLPAHTASALQIGHQQHPAFTTLHVRAHFLIAVRAFQLDKGTAADELWPFWVNCKGLGDSFEREKRFLLIFPSWAS